MQLIAASCDAVALDSVAAQVMGFEPMKIPLLAECARRGLGAVEPGDIDVIGEPAEAFAVPDFARPTSITSALVLQLMPRWLFGTVFEALVTKRAHIDQGRCIRCGECEKNCPSHAISHSGGRSQYRVNRRLCISCFCCGEVCPADAVSLRGTWLRRAVRLARAPFR
jgi:ferredoxin